MLSPGVSEGSWGERRDAEGRVGRCGAAAEVDASVHRYGWWWARLLSFFLPHRSAWSHLISCCLAALLNCFGCACTASSVAATVFLGRESIRLGLGRHPTRRLFSLASSSLTCILFLLNFHFIFQFLRFCCR